MSFLDSVKNSTYFNNPFPHCEFNSILNEEMIDEVYSVFFAKNDLRYDGTRAIDGGIGKFRKGKSNKDSLSYDFRCFIDKNNSKDFKNLTYLVDELRQKDTYQYIGELIKKDLSNSYVRLEILCDRPGFWLKPHCDIKEKLLSSIIYVNRFGSNENMGTDFYNEKLNVVKTIVNKNNYGYFFAAGTNTWHGVEKNKVIEDRYGVQINYVTFSGSWPVQ
jgi:Rps23 Pro-64 3,4-dihydroxylase Tpa1-like proline 4-hydroxylase